MKGLRGMKRRDENGRVENKKKSSVLKIGTVWIRLDAAFEVDRGR